jgi:uncharacterized protein (TIGR01777 family)
VIENIYNGILERLETSMKILIAGASGMIGSILAPYLASQGYGVSRLVRRSPVAGEVFWDPEAGSIDAAGLEGFDGVVNLASMPWPARWTTKAKKQIYANRTQTNSLIAKALSGCTHKPGVLICSSGMGIYPSSGDQILTEDSQVGTNWLAHLQFDGETATVPASNAGIRVVNLRTPPVLGGDALRRSIGRMGSGQQWSSWVSRDELTGIIHHVLMTTTLVGPVNPVSPHPVSNAEFTEVVSRVKGQKPGPAMPAFLLRLMLGEMADALILASRRMIPSKLQATGYQFRFPELELAVRHELGEAT